MYYLNNFFIYSIFGFVFENFVCIIFNSNPESGFMYGPITPIYGLGILIILFIYKKLKFKKEYKKAICLFLISFVLLTIIEYLGGILIKHIFKDTMWNYSRLPLSIGKYISIEISFIWGIMSVIYIYFIKKLSDRLALIIPKWMTYAMTFIFVIDLVFTIFNKQS